MKKGVSLVSLIITIIVIIILASITIFSSLNTVEQSQLVKSQTEFEEVCTFVRTISTKAQAGILDLNLTADTLASEEQLTSLPVGTDVNELSAGEQNTLAGANSERKTSDLAKFGYHYIQGSKIQNDVIPGLENLTSLDMGFTVPNKVENDYIINFYYGTVIAKVSPTKTLIRGEIK